MKPVEIKWAQVRPSEPPPPSPLRVHIQYDVVLFRRSQKLSEALNFFPQLDRSGKKEEKKGKEEEKRGGGEGEREGGEGGLGVSESHFDLQNPSKIR